MHTLMQNGILAEGTPEAREGLVKGELVGGVLALLYGKGKSSSSAPVDAPRPIALTTGLGTPPPLVVVPNATGVVVGAGGVVTVTAAAGEMTAALSTGGGGDSESDAGRVTVGGQPWRVFQPGEAACQSGCDAVAQAIQKAIGGEVKTFGSPAGPNAVLGRVKNAAGDFANPAGSSGRGWFSHTVVVKDGRVYDALTGPAGRTIAEYKALWEYGDVIDFGF